MQNDKAIALDPKLAGAYLWRGLAHYAQGNVAGAIADLERAADFFLQQGRTVEQQKVLKMIEEIRRQ